MARVGSHRSVAERQSRQQPVPDSSTLGSQIVLFHFVTFHLLMLTGLDIRAQETERSSREEVLSAFLHLCAGLALTNSTRMFVGALLPFSLQAVGVTGRGNRSQRTYHRTHGTYTTPLNGGLLLYCTYVTSLYIAALKVWRLKSSTWLLSGDTSPPLPLLSQHPHCLLRSGSLLVYCPPSK
jgi:hypothetical protein